MKTGYKNICLIGFMGVGKTSVGKLLAKKLSLPFYDTDEIVERRVGMSIPEIFERFGEGFFRQKEQSAAKEVLTKSGAVVALGGGAFVNPKIKKNAKGSLVICLSSSLETSMKKLEEFQNTRPLLKNKTFEEIQELYDIRVACYAGCDFNLNVDDLSVKATVAKILTFLKKGTAANH